jgi:hypothetical protein
MKIAIKPEVTEVQCQGSWWSKIQGVVLVEREADIEPVWKVLCEQDDYWESYKELIKVAPTEVTHPSDLQRLCEYCGKTDIYNVKAVKAKLAEQGIDIILYQYRDYEY